MLPDEYLRFIELFNRGEYWESHEVLEAPWRRHGSRFYKGMIIYASAFVHAQRGNPRGVWKQLLKAERYLAEFTPHYMGLDLLRLMDHLRRCKAMVDQEALSAAGLECPTGPELTRTIPYDRLTLEAKWVRGDEPELSDARVD